MTYRYSRLLKRAREASRPILTHNSFEAWLFQEIGERDPIPEICFVKAMAAVHWHSR
jgi:hypothetical protein